MGVYTPCEAASVHVCVAKRSRTNTHVSERRLYRCTLVCVVQCSVQQHMHVHRAHAPVFVYERCARLSGSTERVCARL